MELFNDCIGALDTDRMAFDFLLPHIIKQPYP